MTGRKNHDPPPLDAQDMADWHAAMRDVTAYADSLPYEQALRTGAAPGLASKYPAQPMSRHPPTLMLPGDDLPALKAGVPDGIDKASWRRLKRGQWPIDHRIDLHGLTQLQAFERLEQEIQRSAHMGCRLLLVITGKGRGGEGVLKTRFSEWLNEARLRPYVLAFDRARREDGGSGAYVVLLKQLRAMNVKKD